MPSLGLSLCQFCQSLLSCEREHKRLRLPNDCGCANFTGQLFSLCCEFACVEVEDQVPSFVGEFEKVVSCCNLHDGMGRTAALFFPVQDSSRLVWSIHSNNSHIIVVIMYQLLMDELLRSMHGMRFLPYFVIYSFSFSRDKKFSVR
jgi:hypothetical protein